jgi:ATP-citrate lyase beta-subunit
LMTREKAEGGKVLIIGGGIANFTDVAKTFDGIIMALEAYAAKLKEHGIKIYVRRGGPNYEAGLAKIRAAGQRLGLDMAVHGPDMHMTKVVSIALQNLEGGK